MKLTAQTAVGNVFCLENDNTFSVISPPTSPTGIVKTTLIPALPGARTITAINSMASANITDICVISASDATTWHAILFTNGNVQVVQA